MFVSIWCVCLRVCVSCGGRMRLRATAQGVHSLCRPPLRTRLKSHMARCAARGSPHTTRETRSSAPHLVTLRAVRQEKSPHTTRENTRRKFAPLSHIASGAKGGFPGTSTENTREVFLDTHTPLRPLGYGMLVVRSTVNVSVTLFARPLAGVQTT